MTESTSIEFLGAQVICAKDESGKIVGWSLHTDEGGWTKQHENLDDAIKEAGEALFASKE